MPRGLLSTFLLFLSLISQGQADDARIRGAVNLRTKMHVAAINLHYTVHKTDSNSNEFTFYLAKDARIKTLRADDLLSFTFDTSVALPTLRIKLEKDVKKGDEFEFFIDYEIALDSMNINRYGFVELGLDWFWFPVHPSVSDWNVRYDLLVEIDDPEYQMFGNGTVERVSGNSFTMTAIQPDFDIDLFLMKSPKVYSRAGKLIRVIGSDQNSMLKDSIVELTHRYLEFYESEYGSKVQQVTAVIRPILNDPNGFGYARKGYFVLSEPNRLAQLDFYIAHELAHFWWLNGEPRTNGWITESFAEFSAMLLTRKFHGQQAYDQIIKDKQGRLERLKKDGRDVPVVYGSGSANKGMFSHIPLYHKGPLLLHELEQEIGSAKMEQLMKKAADKKIRTSEEFISLLRKQTSGVIADKFLHRLKTF